MSQIYAEIIGQDVGQFLSFSASIITMGNVLAVLVAVVYDAVSKKIPKLTGNGVMMKDISKEKPAAGKEEEEKQVQITATDMGGSGDLAILGAAKRMELMSYSQISTRIGGAVVLLLASIVFTFIK